MNDIEWCTKYLKKWLALEERDEEEAIAFIEEMRNRIECDIGERPSLRMATGIFVQMIRQRRKIHE